jgi:hypothetical protein
MKINSNWCFYQKQVWLKIHWKVTWINTYTQIFIHEKQLRCEERIVKLKEFILVHSQSVHYLNRGDYTFYDIIQDLLSTLINIRPLIFVKSWGMHLENRHTPCKICDFHRSEMKSSGMWHYADWYYRIIQWQIPELCNFHLYSNVKQVLFSVYIKSTLYLKMLLKHINCICML